MLDEWWLCNEIQKIENGNGTVVEPLIESVKEYCKERNINFKEKWRYYTKKAGWVGGWLKELMGEKGVGFRALCKYVDEERAYKDYESACAYVHGQDIATKLGPFTYYSSIYNRLFLMMNYIFKSIRLFEDDEGLEEEMEMLERELAGLGNKYLK